MSTVRNLILLLLILLLVSFSSNLLALYVNWLWFEEIGQASVLLTTLGAEYAVGLAAGLIAFLFMLLNLAVSHRYRRSPQRFQGSDLLALPLRLQIDSYLGKLIPIVSAVFAFLIAMSGAARWEDYLLFSRSAPFNMTEPVFNKDIGFYLFQLPFLEYVQGMLSALLILTLIATGLLYIYHGGISLTPQGLSIARIPRRHLFLLVGLFFIVKAAGYRFEAYDLLSAHHGVVAGAVYADIHARLPVLSGLSFLTVFVGAVIAVSGFTRGWFLPLGALGLLVTVSLGGGSIYPDLLHRFKVLPNEIELERPYIERNIAATRLAYGLNNIQEEVFPAEETLTPADLARNHLTIKNVRLWDHRPLLVTYRQLQQIRTYYDFVDVDNDRYFINGEYRQVMLSPRELNDQNLPGGANWINEHLTYTHGYGVTMGPVNRISKEGLPEFLLKDIPPVAVSDITVTRPQIYYSEIANAYVFVKTNAQEFDYPMGDKNEYSVYEGRGGVPIRSLGRKLLFAAYFGSMKILLSNDILPESRILYYRNVLERARQVAPFLRYDRDPYMVITRDGRLVWILDGYTTGNRFPYAQPLRGIGNYIRNSVKVVVDAYDGTMDFYINDPRDPIVQTYAKIFPSLLKSMEEMPSDLRAHLRYPQDLFKIQFQLFATYHMQNTQIFYNREDLWTVPRQGEKEMEPYYTIMKFPKETKEEFILMSPYTPARRDNMAAWLAARSDGENYGKLIVFLFPKQKLIYGPRQIEARIDQDAQISQQLTLWNQRGSQVIRGSLLVIPIENSVLYIEPLYLAAEAGSLPELRRVIVTFGNQLSMADDLETALSNIFGGKPATQRAAPEAAGGLPERLSLGERLQSALTHFQKAQTYLKEGNWAGYGEELKQVESILRELARNEPKR
ncbi:MAG: UPF0182 family protein [Nitrospirae bacterium]|nr:UPF0182 family protein [Nitrospirota bacterium]